MWGLVRQGKGLVQPVADPRMLCFEVMGVFLCGGEAEKDRGSFYVVEEGLKEEGVL